MISTWFVGIVDLGEGRLREMMKVEFDMQVLSISIPGVELLDSSSGTTLERQINDEVAQAIRKYPERFSAFAAMPPRIRFQQRWNSSER